MITVSEFIQFVKKNKEAGVWLESGRFRLHERGSDGRSPHVDISSSLFNFCSSLGIIGQNNYMGFKGFRTFDIDMKLIKTFKAKDLEVLFEEYQVSLKKNMMKDIKQLKKVSGIKMSSRLGTYTDSLTEAKIDFSLREGTYRRHGGSTPPKLIIGKQVFTYFKWNQSYNDVLKYIESRIIKMEELVQASQINEYSSLSDYALAPLPKSIGDKLYSLYGYRR